MTDRLKSMKRLARVQTQVKRLAEADLLAAENRKSELDAAVLGLEAFTRDPDLSHGLASMAMRQRRRLATRQIDAEQSLAAQTEVTREARARVKLVERMVETIGQDEARVEERRDLERLIEAMANRDPETSASLP